MRHASRTRRFVVAATLLLAATTARAQQRPQTISGRVTSDSGAAIAAADVIVTVAPTAESIAGKSDANGNYRIVIPTPTGEYILYVGTVGKRPFRQRVTIPLADTGAVVNVRLATAITTVAAVRVEAQRPRPPRSLGAADGIGTDGNSKVVDGVSNGVSPELQGNFDAMATLIPGLAVTPNGVSAFGLGSDANATQLNGMSFNGAAVPRDIPVTTNFLLSPWDPTRGGFSGALTSASVARGGNIIGHRAHVSLDAPALQVGDPVASRFGQKFTNVLLSDTRFGAFSLDKYFYNYSIQASRQTASVSSLLALDADALTHAGISADSARRLTQLLSAAQIPVGVGGIPSQRTTTSALFLGRFDRAVPNLSPDRPPPPIYSLVVGGNYQQSEALGLSPVALPANSGKATNGGGFLQGIYARNFGKFGDYANETAANVSFNESRGTPYLALPSGSVLIASALPEADGSTAPTVGTLAFGGNSGLARDNRVMSFEMNNQTDFLVNHHTSLPAKLYFQGRYEHFDQSVAANRAGAYTYASLADVANNTPSTFSRTLNIPDRSGGEWIGAAALGGSWTIPKLTLAGGARVDANAFTGLPDANPQLASTFGVANDHAPNSISVSPRLGFTWYPHAVRYTHIYGMPLSTTWRSAYQFRGGIGQFRNYLPSSLLADAIGATGLPGSTERLLCVGPAVPSPDWAAFSANEANIPSSCAGGATTFADTASNATIVSSRFRPSKAWRATLGWSDEIKDNFISIDGTYSLNLNQASSVDLNFAGTPQFTLANEGGRPVFVPTSSIVGATGSASPVQSRVSTAFGRVTERVSDLRGDARQITAYMIPNLPISFGVVTLGYSYIDARTETRGFDGSTARDPRAIEWASSAFAPRHQVTLQTAKYLFHGLLGVTVAGRVMSGLRYTPTIAGDVNGDGAAGDRAFIFNPTSADTAVANGMRDLLAHGSSSARTCLTNQLNTLAGRNSCIGPWTATMNASIVMPNGPLTNNRVQASLNLSNPLGGLDQLLHGSSNLDGWGSAPLLDGTLYQVRGFDQTTRTFLYRVNPRFGATNPSVSTFRAPFRITLDVRVDYGHSAPEQALELNLRVRPPLVGTRAIADTIKARYQAAQFTDVYRVLLMFGDSIALSRSQTEAIRAEQRILLAKADTIYSALGAEFAALPKNYSPKDALSRANEASDAGWRAVAGEVPFLRELLTPGQVRLLAFPIRDLMTTPDFRRFYFGPNVAAIRIGCVNSSPGCH